jgi:hypothetical protein
MWLGNTPLEVESWQLFQICEDPEVEVAKVRVDNQWRLRFKRSLEQCAVLPRRMACLLVLG